MIIPSKKKKKRIFRTYYEMWKYANFYSNIFKTL